MVGTITGVVIRKNGCNMALPIHDETRRPKANPMLETEEEKNFET
jgi:hypothetical protein